MPDPSIDGAKYQVRIKWLLHGQACFNVLTFVSRGVLDLQAIMLTNVLTCLQDSILPVLGQDVTLVGADYKRIDAAPAQEGSITLTTDNVGGETAESLPSTNAAVLALRSSHPGRSGKGRMFLPGISEVQQANSLLNPTFITAAVAYLLCMKQQFSEQDPPATAQFVWNIHSRKDAAFYPIVGTSVTSVIASLRSRKRQG